MQGSRVMHLRVAELLTCLLLDQCPIIAQDAVIESSHSHGAALCRRGPVSSGAVMAMAAPDTVPGWGSAKRSVPRIRRQRERNVAAASAPHPPDSLYWHKPPTEEQQRRRQRELVAAAEADNARNSTKPHWPRPYRFGVAKCWVAGLTPEQLAEFAEQPSDKQSPPELSPPVKSRVYDAAERVVLSLRHQVPYPHLDKLVAESERDGEAGKDGRRALRKAITQLTRSWGQHLLVHDNVDDRPRPSGELFEARKDTLAKMVALLLGTDGRGAGFTSIAHARAASLDFTTLAWRLGLRTERAIWLELRKFAPRLVKKKWKVVKTRTPAVARSCASQVLSHEPAQFARCYDEKEQDGKSTYRMEPVLRFVPHNEDAADAICQGLDWQYASSAVQPTIPKGKYAFDRVRAGPLRAQADADDALLKLADALAAAEQADQRGLAPHCNASTLEHARAQVAAAEQRIAELRELQCDLQSSADAAWAAKRPPPASKYFTAEALALLPQPPQALDARGTFELTFPVGPPAAHGDAPPTRTARGRWLSINHEDYQYYWDPENIDDQWQIDAFTTDPQVFLSDLKAIGEEGVPMPVQQLEIMNKSVGALPKMLVYIAVHPQHGTRVFYPYSGARGGQKKENTYDGYQYWCSNLADWQKEQLVQFAHYNQTGAWSHQHVAARRLRVSERFSPDNFLVRHTSSQAFALDTSAFHSLCSGSLYLFKNNQAICKPTLLAAVTFLSSLPASFPFTA